MLSTTHPGMDDVPYIYMICVRDPYGHTEGRQNRTRKFLIHTVCARGGNGANERGIYLQLFDKKYNSYVYY